MLSNQQFFGKTIVISCKYILVLLVIVKGRREVFVTRVPQSDSELGLPIISPEEILHFSKFLHSMINFERSVSTGVC